jgi:hypothetical protein
MQQFPIVYGNGQSSHLVRAVAASYGPMRSEIRTQAGGRFIDQDVPPAPRRVHRHRSAAQAVRTIPPVKRFIGGRPFEVIGVGEDKVSSRTTTSPTSLRVHSMDVDERWPTTK